MIRRTLEERFWADNNRDMFAKGRARPRRFGDADRAKALRALAVRAGRAV